MKRLFVCLIIGLLLATPAVQIGFGQAPAAQNQSGDYVVQDGDNLWELSNIKLSDPTLWKQVVKENPILSQPGRTFTNAAGKIIVLLHPGEVLHGLDKLGILPTAVPIDQLKSSAPPQVTVVTQTPLWAYFPLGILLLLILAAVVGYLVLRRILRKDPVNSGQPVIPGGVNNESAGHAFQMAAHREYQASTGYNAPIQDFTVLEQVAGRIFGNMNVRYQGGRTSPRTLNGERAYRARVRFPNGTEETLYMLQACGNDLRFGGVSRYMPGPAFRFEPDAPAQTATSTDNNSAPAPAPAQPAAVPPTAELKTEATSSPESEKSASEPEDGVISIEFQTADAGGGEKDGKDKDKDMLRVSGIEVSSLTLTQRPNHITIRFKRIPKQS